MTGLSFNEFYDKLYYGADIEFTLDKWHYMICCGWEENHNGKIHSIAIVKSDQPFYEQVIAPKIWDEIFESKMKDANKNIETFLQAKLFDNMSFYEIKSDIVVNYS